MAGWIAGFKTLDLVVASGSITAGIGSGLEDAAQARGVRHQPGRGAQYRAAGLGADAGTAAAP